MKSGILAILAILILGGGGGGAYLYFKDPAIAAIGDTEEHVEAHEADKHDDGHGGGHSGGDSYVELDPLVLPIIDGSGVNQVISIVVVLEVDGSWNMDKVARAKPKLKDAYIQEMYGVLNKAAVIEGGVLKVDIIKRRLNRISQKVMGEGVITDVLLQVVQQRPM